MDNQTASLQEVLDALAGLRAEVTALSQRVATLEGLPAPESARAPVARGSEGVSDEVLLTISAAVAAYLGVKAHIRQIRLVESPSWAMQGRATIQASHALPIRHS